MPRMSTAEALFCRSALWHFLAPRMIPWATQDCSLAGRVLEIGGGSGAMAEAIIHSHGQVNLTTTDVDPAMARPRSDPSQDCPLRHVRLMPLPCPLQTSPSTWW